MFGGFYWAKKANSSSQSPDLPLQAGTSPVVDVRFRSRTAFVNMFVYVRLRSFTDLRAAATMFVNKRVHEPFVYVRLSIARRAAQEGHTRAKIGHATRDLSKGLRLASGSGLGRGQVSRR